MHSSYVLSRSDRKTDVFSCVQIDCNLAQAKAARIVRGRGLRWSCTSQLGRPRRWSTTAAAYALPCRSTLPRPKWHITVSLPQK